MYTVITVILNANGFAIGSVVSLRWSQCTQRKSMFRDSIAMTSEHPIIYQVFLTLIINLLFNVILVRGRNIIFGILAILCC